MTQCSDWELRKLLYCYHCRLRNSPRLGQNHIQDSYATGGGQPNLEPVVSASFLSSCYPDTLALYLDLLLHLPLVGPEYLLPEAEGGCI